MISYDRYLRKQLDNPKIREAFDEERELLEMAFKLNEERKKQGKSQSEAARDAHLTQQQFSKVENGENCTIMTYLRACHAIGLKMELKPVK